MEIVDIAKYLNFVHYGIREVIIWHSRQTQQH